MSLRGFLEEKKARLADKVEGLKEKALDAVAEAVVKAEELKEKASDVAAAAAERAEDAVAIASVKAAELADRAGEKTEELKAVAKDARDQFTTAFKAAVSGQKPAAKPTAKKAPTPKAPQ